ncbi:MAG: D-aminoacyl-tRNA deacylase [Myxococcota bacterium]
MRAVVQRVSSARVRVGADEVAAMGAGLLALVGVARGDGAEQARALAKKLVELRVLSDAEGRMNRCLLDTGGSLGLVSEFTLLGDARKGRRPSYQRAAPAEEAAPLLEVLAGAVASHGVPVVSGRFRAEMEVELVNDGPVTLLLDTEREF